MGAVLTWGRVLSGELQWIKHDDASADFLLGKEKLPARHPSGVQAVRPPAQPEGPAALAAGKYTQNYTQNCLTSRSHELPTHFLGGQPVAGSHIPNRLPSSSSSKIHRSGLRWPSLNSLLIFSSLNIHLNPALTLYLPLQSPNLSSMCLSSPGSTSTAPSCSSSQYFPV